MKVKQVISLVVFLLASMATWLLVWQAHYAPCIATIPLSMVSAWKVGFIDR